MNRSCTQVKANFLFQILLASIMAMNQGCFHEEPGFTDADPSEKTVTLAREKYFQNFNLGLSGFQKLSVSSKADPGYSLSCSGGLR